jgi:hypothetical protein
VTELSGERTVCCHFVGINDNCDVCAPNLVIYTVDTTLVVGIARYAEDEE